MTRPSVSATYLRPTVHESTRGVAYLAGPRTGIANYNTPAFAAAAADLRARGWQIVSPAEFDNDMMNGTGEPLPPEVYHRGLRRCLQVLLRDGVGTIIMLPGSKRSKGASIEHQVAEVVGMRVLCYPEDTA